LGAVTGLGVMAAARKKLSILLISLSNSLKFAFLKNPEPVKKILWNSQKIQN
jgi:hypothetical protein